MSELRATPGPWCVYDQTEELEESWCVGMGSYIDDPNDYLASDFWLCEGSCINSEYNAYLISAAPDLYEALDSIITNATKQTCSKGQFRKAILALRKARGES